MSVSGLTDSLGLYGLPFCLTSVAPLATAPKEFLAGYEKCRFAIGLGRDGLGSPHSLAGFSVCRIVLGLR